MIKWIWNDEWYIIYIYISRIDDIDVSHGIIHDWGMMLLRIYFHDFVVIQTASKTLFERDRSNSGNASGTAAFRNMKQIRTLPDQKTKINRHLPLKPPNWEEFLEITREFCGESRFLCFSQGNSSPNFHSEPDCSGGRKNKRSDDGDWFIDRLFGWPRRQA